MRDRFAMKFVNSKTISMTLLKKVMRLRKIGHQVGSFLLSTVTQCIQEILFHFFRHILSHIPSPMPQHQC